MKPSAREVHAVFRCDRCERSRVPISDMVLRLGIHDGSWSFRVRCPRCGLIRLEDAPDSVVSALLEHGAATEAWRAPAPEVAPLSTPFDACEIFEWHRLLEDDERLARAAADL